MSSKIRFASVPKSATRSLQKLGLLGEVGDLHHAPIDMYPEFEKYDWHVVVRDEKIWLDSWWRQCKKSNDLFAIGCGMRFLNKEDDLEKLTDQRNIVFIPQSTNVNAWVPVDVVDSFGEYIKMGKSFYEYCFDTITKKYPCKRININELNKWLINRGYIPPWENRDENGDS